MKKNEIFLEAEYMAIILELLQEPYNIKSLSKLVFISFGIKYEKSVSYKNRKSDFIHLFANNIGRKLIYYSKDLILIFNAINILEETQKISVVGDDINLINPIKIDSRNKFLKDYKGKTPHPINEINKLFPKDFLEEVMRNV